MVSALIFVRGYQAYDWMPEGHEPLADGEYDAIVLGTGLKECIMSGLLAVNGKKVLHIDRNNYYGGDCASVNLTNLYAKFRPGQDAPVSLGQNRDFNVDLIPKFLMACGKLVKILLHTKVTRYLEFKNVDGSYVVKNGKPQKVPVTGEEALRSSLMGMFEKRRFVKFVKYVDAWDEKDPKTFGKFDINTAPMKDVYKYYGLDANTQTFVGHAIALHLDDSYLERPARETIDRTKLYLYSLERYGKSPYLYPIYGLGGLPEGFSRLCAIHGGTFMLARPVDELLFDDSGKCWGIKSTDPEDGTKQAAKAPMIIGDPSYFPSEKLEMTGKVIRSICILDHPIANTKDSESCQIIIPAKEVPGKNNDIYICVISAAHCVTAKGKWIAIASTEVETDDPIKEISSALSLCEPILERFDECVDRKAPIGAGADDSCFISKSYDATSHFETVANDVLDMHVRVFGTELDMTINADSTNVDE